MKIFTKAALGIALLPCMSFAAQQPAALSPAENDNTNFIVVLVDDLGYDESGFMGADDMFTPNLDKIAAGGTHFTQGYVTSSVCGPSRAGLISGRYQDRLGIWGNFSRNAKIGFPTSQPMMQDHFKAAGYTTGTIGKWHYGHFEEEHKPWNRNLDYFYGFLGGGHDYFKANTHYNGKNNQSPIYRNGEMVNYPNGTYLTDEFSREAVEFIERNHEKPFFLHLAYNAVHAPYQAPDHYLKRVDELMDGEFATWHRRVIAAMLLAMDDGLGNIMETLEEKGIRDNTAIVFLSDNGYQTIVRRKEPVNLAGNPADLRGFKGDTFEGGIRVPFVINWPDVVPAGKQYTKPVMALDILPTITRDIPLVENTPELDGVDLIPYLNGEIESRPHETMFFRFFHDIAYRKGDWVLTWNDQHKVAGEKRANRELVKEDVKAMLFNLNDDVAQRRDLRNEEPEKFQELLNEYLALLEEFPEPEYPALFQTPYTVEFTEDL
ncbi:sulfatase-like hydrolase/transferase [Photobacterium makurazakiensis]|uniref:sulfatase family protein n=1 Tax=Photobacterium makurazakiensis TaxID=2910234 RepID=UPI003D125674